MPDTPKIADYVPGARIHSENAQSRRAETYLRLAWKALARADKLSGQRRITKLNSADAYLALYDKLMANA